MAKFKEQLWADKVSELKLKLFANGEFKKESAAEFFAL